jgi:hypothetical protein
MIQSDLELEDFGGGITLGPIVDNTPALNAAIAAMANRQNRTLRLRAGFYYFLSQPNLIDTTMNIVGQSMGASFLMRYYNGTSQTGFLHFLAPACKVSSLGITAAVTVNGVQTTGGCAIALVGYASTTFPDWFVCEDVYISGGANTPGWDYAFFANGQNRPAGQPPGVRDLHIRNCHLFSSSLAPMRLYAVNGANINACFYSAPVPASSGTVQIDGDAQHTSNNIVVSTNYLEKLEASWTNNLTVLHALPLSVTQTNVNNLSTFP